MGSGHSPCGLVDWRASVQLRVMRMLSVAVAPVLLACGLAHSPGFACSRVMRHYSNSEISLMAARAYESATTVVDGEVISPMANQHDLPDGALPVAYIKIAHAWKGKVDSESDGIVAVAYESSCDVFLGIKGQKLRILLSGTGIFTADQETNGWAATLNGDAFNRAIDQLIGQPRPLGFINPGEPPPSAKE